MNNKRKAIVKTGRHHMDEGQTVTVEKYMDKWINVHQYIDCGAGLSQNIYRSNELIFMEEVDV